MAMTLNELIEHCTNQSAGCTDCTAKKDCQKFKQALKNLTEPWEMNRLYKAFEEDMK